MSRSVQVRAVQNRSAVPKPTGRLLQVEATDLKEVVNTQVDSTVFESDDKDVC